MFFAVNLLMLPLRLLLKLFQRMEGLESSDPLRKALDKGWLYTKYAVLTLFILLNLAVFSGVPHLRWSSTVHTSRSGELQGKSEYIGPFGNRTLEANETGPIPSRIAFIPVYKIFEH